MTQAAAFYDLDKTIIAKSSTLAFRRPFALAGLIGPSDSLAFGAAQTYYRVAGASHGQLEDSKARLSTMIRGWPVDKVEALVAGTVEQLIAPYVYVDALKSIRWHKDEGRLIVIISSSPREWVEPIGYMIGADRVIATQLGVSGGQYNGDVLFYAYGEQKAVAVRALAQAEGLDLSESWAYSDSFTDLPMLEEVGHAVAVNPDADLRTAAEQRGWEIAQYVRPPSWDSPLSFVWDAVAALPDVQAALKIGANGYVQLAKGSAVATKDVASALLGLATGSDEDRAFFPSVRSRRIRGLNAVTADEVRATFGNAAPVSASDLLRLAGDTQSQSAAAVQGAVEGVTEAVAEAVEVLEGAMGAAIDTAITGATGVVSGSQTDESPAPDAAPAKPRRTRATAKPPAARPAAAKRSPAKAPAPEKPTASAEPPAAKARRTRAAAKPVVETPPDAAPTTDAATSADARTDPESPDS